MASSTITINEISGFTDTTSVAPVGGNPGVTVGQQRSNVFRAAADWWQTKLNSSVTIVVDAKFQPLSCSAYSGVLGSAGPQSGHVDFQGAPLASTIYVQALANSLEGYDLSPITNDIIATFNSNVGTTGCLQTISWYYGLDQNPAGNQIDLYQVVLHEMAHGLGFITWVDQDGTRPLWGSTYLNDPFMVLLEDHSLGRLYPDMTDTQRQAANIDTGDLHWTGNWVKAASSQLSAGKVGNHVRMFAPNPYQSASSVSHWDTALTPNELMEPSYTQANPLTSMTLAAMRDMGWSVNAATSAPSITTASITSITAISAQAGGNVTSDNGSAVTARGVCWDTLPNPDLLDAFTTDGSGTGSFVSTITGLASGTPYYVRAYATNLQGTAYGQQEMFTTLAGGSCPPCSGSVVVLENVTFESGLDCECVGTTSITAGTGVTVESGATVTFRAPIVTTTPGFHVETGAQVNI
ncbi:MAG: hypothetical protein V1793_02560, partial [Pseudomonadota bacterium]